MRLTEKSQCIATVNRVLHGRHGRENPPFGRIYSGYTILYIIYNEKMPTKSCQASKIFLQILNYTCSQGPTQKKVIDVAEDHAEIMVLFKLYLEDRVD